MRHQPQHGVEEGLAISKDFELLDLWDRLLGIQPIEIGRGIHIAPIGEGDLGVGP